MRIATVNVNGIRAAHRKGMMRWLEERDVDILCLQEVRAPDGIVRELLDGWVVHHAEAEAKGRAGVAVASRRDHGERRIGVGDGHFDASGRWVEVDFDIDGTHLTVVSAYVHSGEAGTPKQDDKYRFLEAMDRRLPELARRGHAVVTGDLNIAHAERDIKNWKGNLKKAGFLPEERAYLDRFLTHHGWTDVGRNHHGDVEGPYTWWSYRGQAFDNDAGWRIDYHLTTPGLGEKVEHYAVDRAPSYGERWSDHAPVVVDYAL